MVNPISFEDVPKIFSDLKKQIQKVVIGQDEIIQYIFSALLCKSHILLVGLPGLAKTTLVESFSKTLNLSFNRIQFTPDLMPSDIIGSEVLQENKISGNKELIFHKGPLFTNFLLGDEINRTPPKTQSALLQAMQEHTVTIFGRTEILSSPFMVLATQNPIEQEGTYPLPEAQLDRFLYSLTIGYPTKDEELQIIKTHSFSLESTIESVLETQTISDLQAKVLDMSVSDHIFESAVNIIRSTRPGNENQNPLINKYVQWGASPRACNFLILSAKSMALIDGRPTPTISDLRKAIHPILNHRIILNFNAESEGITKEKIINSLASIID